MNRTEEKKVEEKDQSSGKSDCSDLEEVAFNIVLENMVRKGRRKSKKISLGE